MTERQRFEALVERAFNHDESAMQAWIESLPDGFFERGLAAVLKAAEPTPATPFSEWAQDNVPGARMLSSEPMWRFLADRLEADMEATS
jgi:hypothetical protein